MRSSGGLGALAHAEGVDEAVKFPAVPVPARKARGPKKESRVQQSMKRKRKRNWNPRRTIRWPGICALRADPNAAG